MIALPHTPDPVRFLAYAFQRSTDADMLSRLTEADIASVPDAAPPGIIGPRSWTCWRAVVGRTPPPARPARVFGGKA